MIKHRLFYININYICNNKCIYCISTSTKYGLRKVDEPFKDIIRIDTEFKLSSDDVFVISGGEPTLTKNFQDILNFLAGKCHHVVVYTNGRLLNEPEIQKCFNLQNIRWIVSLYGTEKTHDKYVGVDNVFNEVYNNLKDFDLSIKKKFDIKLILNNSIDVEEIKQIKILSKDFACFHISCINNKNDDISKKTTIIKNLEPIISNLILNSKQKLKISNIPLCELSLAVRNTLLSSIKYQNKSIFDLYVCIDTISYKILNKEIKHSWKDSCKSCKLNKHCIDLNCHFPVSVYDNNNFYLEEE